MKKCIVFVMCFVLGTSLLAGCSDRSDTIFEEKSHTLSETEVSGVNIDVRDREIEVAHSSDNQIHIDYFESDKEYYDISVSEDKVLNMTMENKKEWEDYVGRKASAEHRKIYLQLPEALLSTLALSTTNDDITLCPLTVTKQISVSVNGGKLTFDRLDAGDELTLKAKNGDISGTIVGGYDDYAIECEIKKGESNLPPKKEGGEKTLNVSNNNGDIDIAFIRE